MHFCRLKGGIRIQESGSSLEPVKILSKIKSLSGSYSSSLHQSKCSVMRRRETPLVIGECDLGGLFTGLGINIPVTNTSKFA